MLVHQFKGTMGVGTGDKMYRDTDANYSLDAQQSAPELPEGIDERLYEPDVRHALIANHQVVDGGPMPWPQGDAIIKMADSLIVTQRQRLSAAVEDQRKQINDGIDRELEQKKAQVEDQHKAALAELKTKQTEDRKAKARPLEGK